MSASELHPIFAELNANQLRPDTFDNAIESEKDKIVCVFFWGHDCPNCQVAKRVLHNDLAIVKDFDLKWFHVNTYENFDLGTRFGLHGIPTFLFFYRGKKLGRISPFPGLDPFATAVRELQQKHLGL